MDNSKPIKTGRINIRISSDYGYFTSGYSKNTGIQKTLPIPSIALLKAIIRCLYRNPKYTFRIEKIKVMNHLEIDVVDNLQFGNSNPLIKYLDEVEKGIKNKSQVEVVVKPDYVIETVWQSKDEKPVDREKIIDCVNTADQRRRNFPTMGNKALRCKVSIANDNEVPNTGVNEYIEDMTLSVDTKTGQRRTFNALVQQGILDVPR